jgi:hypothetical protein
MMTHANRPIPFIALICLFIGGLFFGMIAIFAAGADEDVLVAIGIIIFLMAIPALILQFIVGVQLKYRLKAASSVGIMLMIDAEVQSGWIIIWISLLVKGEEMPWGITVVGSIVTIILYWVLREFFKKYKEKKVGGQENTF